MSDTRIESESAALVAPSAARNREPILGVLQTWLPQPGLVLEVASGTGEHAAWFAADLPGVTWQPTDRDPARLASIAAWRAAQGTPNLLAPLLLDAGAPVWPVARADAVLAINMAHIAPWSATLGLVAGAAQVLRRGGLLLLYGPFRMGGAHTSPGNESFDADLRARDPDWGLRDIEAVVAEAEAHAMVQAANVSMPANNRMVVFRRV